MSTNAQTFHPSGLRRSAEENESRVVYIRQGHVVINFLRSYRRLFSTIWPWLQTGEMANTVHFNSSEVIYKKGVFFDLYVYFKLQQMKEGTARRLQWSASSRVVAIALWNVRYVFRFVIYSSFRSDEPPYEKYKVVYFLRASKWTITTLTLFRAQALTTLSYFWVFSSLPNRMLLRMVPGNTHGCWAA